MKILFVSSFILMCLTIAVSCDPVVIDIKLPDESARMTINAYFIADSSWRVGITRSEHVLNPTYEFEDIPDATVSIFEDGQLLTTLIYDPPDPARNEEHGMYISNNAPAILPKPGKTYEVRAHSDKYGDVSAACRIPLPVPLTEIVVNSRDFDDDARMPLTVHLNDPPGEENFYELYARITLEYSDPVTNIPHQFEIQTGVHTVDPPFHQGFETIDLLDPFGKPQPVLFSDVGLDGKLLKINCKLDINFSFDPSIKAYYEIIVRTLSKEYYQHRVTRKLQQVARRDPFAQPVKVYNNIQNGFGIFAGYSQSAMYFE